MSLVIRIACLFLLVVSLVGCSQHDAYQKLYRNPKLLQSQSAKCQSGSLKPNSQACINVNIARQVIGRYVGLQRAQGIRYAEAQQNFFALEKQLKAAGTNQALREKIMAEQKKQLAGYSKMYFSVQEEFGKLVIAQETKLSQLISKRDALLKQTGDSDSKTQLSEVKTQLVKTRRLVNGMLAFVGLSGV